MMSEFLHWRSLGDLFAYGGLIYIAIILYQINLVKKSIASIRHLLAKPADNESSEEGVEPVKPPSKLLAATVLFFIPVLLHLLLYAILARYDPCRGNSGCMAGSLSAYFLVLFTLPTMVLLSIFTLVQVFGSSHNYRKFLWVNTILSVSPFVVGFVGLALITVFR